jgi:hypothetical protein
VKHTVVILGFTDGRGALIGDPSGAGDGCIQWSLDDLRQRWRGEGLRLVKRMGTRRLLK